MSHEFVAAYLLLHGLALGSEERDALIRGSRFASLCQVLNDLESSRLIKSDIHLRSQAVEVEAQIEARVVVRKACDGQDAVLATLGQRQIHHYRPGIGWLLEQNLLVDIVVLDFVLDLGHA